MRTAARGWRTAAGDLAVGLRAGARFEDPAAGRAGAPLPRCGAPARRWRGWVCGTLLGAALVALFPVSLLLYVGVGQEAAVWAVVVSLALMVTGWVVDRG